MDRGYSYVTSSLYFLVAQWLEHRTFNPGSWVRIPAGKLVLTINPEIYFMCLVTPTKKAYTATADLYCYKVLNEVNGQLVTPFRGFPIELGKIYSTEHVSEVSDNEIGEGFLHAYASPSYMYKRKEDYCRNSGDKPAMYLAVIPKGAKFFTNNDCTELCATAIRVIQKVADLDNDSLFSKVATDLNDKRGAYERVNETFDKYKEHLTTMENIVRFAKDNSLYTDIVRKYETFEEGSYEKNLYAYRLIVAVLTEDEKNSLVKGDCYYPYVRFFDGSGYYSPGRDMVKIGTIISNGTSYIVVGGDAHGGAFAGLGSFGSGDGVSYSHAAVGFRSVSSYEIAKFISYHFGKIVFDLMYGCANCDYHWVDEEQ